MIENIVARLKEGRIQSVIPKGFSSRPNPPYVVASLEGQELRVWTHFGANQHVFLEEYCRADLAELLNNYRFTTSNGSTVIIQSARGEIQGYSGITMNEDKTISKERRWTVPGLLF